jgi:hypothetical protein
VQPQCLADVPAVARGALMGYKVVVVESFKSDRCVGSPPFCANELVIALDLRGFESLGELAVRFSPRAA